MNDYIKHIAAGFVVGAIVGLPCLIESGNLFCGLYSGWMAAVIAGGVKEWCDTQYGYGWDWRDLGCTVAGAAIVALFIVAMHFAKG